MNILYITTSRYPTDRAYGIQIEKTVEALRDFGTKVSIKTPPTILQPLLYLGKFGYSLRTLIFVKLLWLSGDLRKFDVIYTRDTFAARLLSIVSKKVFLELHDIRKFNFRGSLTFVKGIIVISRGLRDKLVSLGVSESRILISPDAVDVNKFAIDLDQITARKQFNLPTGKKIVLYAGLFDEWKGYGTLLRASKLFDANTILVMAGGRPEQVNELMKEFSNVQFLGWTDYDKLPVLQRAADVIVIPNSAKFDISRLYTSPLKLFTAMCSGVPIIASDLPSIREILDEGSAILVPPDDPSALVIGVRTVLADSSSFQPLASKARERVQSFTWQNRARDILSFIELCKLQ